MRKGKGIKLGDMVIILILVVASFVPFYFLLAPKKENNSIIAIIKVNNQEVKRLPLDHDIVWKYHKGSELNVVKVKNHKIRMIDANCPDQVCVKEGWKSKSEETIVCLPHKFLIELKNQNENNK